MDEPIETPEPTPPPKTIADLTDDVYGPDAIHEKDGIHKAWYVEAEKVVFQRRGDEDAGKETLLEFMERVVNGYKHDYGTVCHAVASSAIAAAWAANRMEGSRGGITGFQSGAVMWEFIQAWGMDLKGPLRLVKYDDMLYPQYEHKFERTMSKGTWEHLQLEANRKIAESHDHLSTHPDVLAHWHSIVRGEVPFGYKVTED